MDGSGSIKVRNDFLLSTNRPHRDDSICNFARANLNINIISYGLNTLCKHKARKGQQALTSMCRFLPLAIGIPLVFS
jgi:hypothetical protein